MLKNIKIGLAVTGSFCNFSKLEPQINKLKEQGVEEILPIVSYSVIVEENRFSTPTHITELLKTNTSNELVDTISKAEPIGPKDMVDIILVLPCTGNTIAKLAHGITDTPVTMALKSHLRNNKPVVIAASTNDALGANGENILKLLNTKNIYFVPLSQDAPDKKPKSLVYDETKVIDTIVAALAGKQIQPIFK